ncbi:MAG TPA: metallophosphoesterase family protein [Candidatus Sulfotelmatobacter sp.]|nr:metallophosphoesterase family protein [Candidatus Sulfotelmatobacter sp.]
MTTRIALITDVHGNAPALRAILAELDAIPDLAHIYCLGDSVSIGPDENTVLDLLFARTNLTMVRGNHEGYVLSAIKGEPLPAEVGVGEQVHQRWMAARLSPAHADRLATLPAATEAEIEGVRLLFLHYHMANGHFTPWKPDLSRLEEHYAGSAADVVCYGHIHETSVLQGIRRLYVDPGSAGCCHRPVARYAMLTIAAGRVDVELREAHYDNREFLASYESLGVPEREFILRIFHGNQGR